MERRAAALTMEGDRQGTRGRTLMSAEFDGLDDDARKVEIATRLYRLDGDQVRQVAEALGRRADGADDAVALRQSLMSYIEEFANDLAEEAEDDPEAARAAGRSEALGFLEEEVSKLESGALSA